MVNRSVIPPIILVVWGITFVLAFITALLATKVRNGQRGRAFVILAGMTLSLFGSSLLLWAAGVAP